MKLKGIVFIFFLSIRSLYAQVLDCKIIGKVAEMPQMKFAYLVNLQNKTVMISPLKLGSFLFNVKRTEELEILNLVLREDSLMAFDEIASKLKQRNLDRKRIALEDMQIQIATLTKNAKIIGGDLNKAMDGMQTAIDTRNFIGFFNTYPNSPVSIFFLKILVNLNNVALLKGFNDCKLFYSKLSTRLKETDEGKSLLLKIAEN